MIDRDTRRVVDTSTDQWREKNCEPCGADDQQNQFAHKLPQVYYGIATV